MQPKNNAYGARRDFGHGDDFTDMEVSRALRNHGSLYEGLATDVTPTSMHFLLCHFDIPVVDVGQYRLSIHGRIRRPVQLSIDEILKMPAQSYAVTLECSGNGRKNFHPRPKSQPWNDTAVASAEWTGCPLGPLLEKLGVEIDASEILFTGLDQGVEVDEVIKYERSLPIDEALRNGVLLAYAMNGQPLTPPHGYPLRLIVPHWYGMASVKWLRSIEVLDREFHGYYMDKAYRNKSSEDEPGAPITLQKVRSLIIPPGVRYRHDGRRLLKSGPVTLQGKAWAGRQSILRVEISLDRGRSWKDAKLRKSSSEFSWTSWTFPWNAERGRYEILSRATAADGSVQPTSATWNYLGMENNSVQSLSVIVE